MVASNVDKTSDVIHVIVIDLTIESKKLVISPEILSKFLELTSESRIAVSSEEVLSRLKFLTKLSKIFSKSAKDVDIICVLITESNGIRMSEDILVWIRLFPKLSIEVSILLIALIKEIVFCKESIIFFISLTCLVRMSVVNILSISILKSASVFVKV